MTDWGTLIWVAMLVFGAGFYLGEWTEARKWRDKGDHDYMNRIASGRHLYKVKRETNEGMNDDRIDSS